MKKHESTRFIIIGAGAAGLTTAESLKSKGYNHIRILEKEAFAGGKCQSITIDGRSYEIGAGAISSNNKTILDLVEKYNILLKPLVFGQDNLYDLTSGKKSIDLFSLPEKFSFFWQLLLRYYRLSHQFPAVQTPGFRDCESSLFVPFHQWAEENSIPLVEKSFGRFFTGFGYGYWEEIPAAYVLKYYDWPTLVAFLRKEVYTFPNGIQQLWQRVAKEYEVNYNSTISKIIRTPSQVTIETDDTTYEADVLILACPLDASLSFLDASHTESELFSKIIHTQYINYLWRIDNFTKKSGFIPANFCPAKKGHPVFWYKRYLDTNIYSIYVLSDFEVPSDQMLEHVLYAVESLGGEVKHLLNYKSWTYFPHVTASEMQNGYYEKLEDLQGNFNTYYVGELLNFSTVELTAAYAKDLVNRYF